MKRPSIVIFGGSGFLGRYITRRFAKAGWEVRVAVRRPNEALFVRTYGQVGQVEPVQANIRHEASIARVVAGADVVVNATGILHEDRFQTFDGIHHKAAEAIARLSKAAGVGKMVHISAINADENSQSRSSQSKALGEAAVLSHYPEALIARPTVMFGVDDDFFNLLGTMARMSPVMPVVMGNSKLQPVFVDDVANFVFTGIEQGLGGTYELGGGKMYTLRELFEFVSTNTLRNRPVIGMPKFMGGIMAKSLQIGSALTGKLYKNRIMTPDQFKQLQTDSIVTGNDGLAAVGITPSAMEPIVSGYLESYRPRGEFADLVKTKR